MAYLILETNFFARPEIDSVLNTWGPKGVAAVTYLYHFLQQCEDCRCDMKMLTKSARKLGTISGFLYEIITKSGLFIDDSGTVSAPYLDKRLERGRRKKAVKVEDSTMDKKSQVPDCQTKSDSHIDINIDKDIDKDIDKNIDKIKNMIKIKIKTTTSIMRVRRLSTSDPTPTT